MSDKFRAVEEIRSFANRFKALLEFADELEGAASLEQAANEAASRLEEANRRFNQVTSQIDSARARLLEIGSQVDAARTEAVRIVADANQRASEIAKAADEERLRIMRDAEATVGLKANEVAEMETHLDTMRAMKAQLADEISDLESRINKLRAAAARLATGG